jgi:molybdopterin molybdotransferase
MQRRLIDDCFRPDDPQKPFSHHEAVGFLKERTLATAGTETVDLFDACGRILAGPVTAPHSVPLNANSAVDGYAFAQDDAASTGQARTLRIAGVAAAGHPFNQVIGPGEAARILTGAVVPDGCDRVAMQEDCEAHPDAGTVTIPAGLKRGANIRPAGEDLMPGDALFQRGHVVRAPDIAALASIGLGSVPCFTPVQVTLFSTGDELVAPGARPLQPGEVYDANTAMLSALIASQGHRLTRGGVLPDDFAAVRAALEGATGQAGEARVVITSGGASRGSEDHVANAIADLGTRHHWQINIKPGRPVMFGQIGDTVIVGLPGNPVAAFVCFLLYVHPVLRVLGGAPWPEPQRLSLPAAFAFKHRKKGRREYWRAWTETRDDGRMVAVKFPRDGSGLISGLRAATGLIEVPEDAGDIEVGDPVAFIPFTEFGIPPKPTSL